MDADIIRAAQDLKDRTVARRRDGMPEFSFLAYRRDSTDVIMDCYYRMSDIVFEKKNMDRSASMTPSEFASQLENAGLPSDAVRRLTRLFESVRYGGRKSDSVSVNEAVACLTTILHYCGETV